MYSVFPHFCYCSVFGSVSKGNPVLKDIAPFLLSLVITIIFTPGHTKKNSHEPPLEQSTSTKNRSHNRCDLPMYGSPVDCLPSSLPLCNAERSKKNVEDRNPKSRWNMAGDTSRTYKETP
ncbi:hypothetical protein C0J52_26959 [Blattella germanica]|nr:hypothetical protein C0J52_26959 [Blattella germanica]